MSVLAVDDIEPPRGGNCAGADPNIFFAEPGRGSTLQAKAICKFCPVKTECLAWALKYEPFGVWGGKTPKERLQMRREFGTRLSPRYSLDFTEMVGRGYAS